MNWTKTLQPNNFGENYSTIGVPLGTQANSLDADFCGEETHTCITAVATISISTTVATMLAATIITATDTDLRVLVAAAVDAAAVAVAILPAQPVDPVLAILPAQLVDPVLATLPAQLADQAKAQDTGMALELPLHTLETIRSDS